MIKTINSTLRLPPALAAALDQVAEEAGVPRHTLILQILDEALGHDDAGPRLSPTLVIGYIPLTSGELDAADCPECGQPIAQPHVGFIVGARRPLPIGPVCALCATTQSRIVVRMDNYGHRLSDFLTLWQQAKKDFPTLTESDVEIVHYGGRYIKGYFGLEFQSAETIPPDYQQIRELEDTL